MQRWPRHFSAVIIRCSTPSIEAATVADAKAEMTTFSRDVRRQSRAFAPWHAGDTARHDADLPFSPGAPFAPPYRHHRPAHRLPARSSSPGSGLRAVVECIGWTTASLYYRPRLCAGRRDAARHGYRLTFAINTLGPAQFNGRSAA